MTRVNDLLKCSISSYLSAALEMAVDIRAHNNRLPNICRWRLTLHGIILAAGLCLDVLRQLLRGTLIVGEVEILGRGHVSDQVVGRLASILHLYTRVVSWRCQMDRGLLGQCTFCILSTMYSWCSLLVSA